jgi:hypothetical protein
MKWPSEESVEVVEMNAEVRISQVGRWLRNNLHPMMSPRRQSPDASTRPPRANASEGSC